MRVIGISSTHDSSVACINDGQLEYYFKEERYSRTKRDPLPYLSLEKLRDELGGQKVDWVVITTPEPDWSILSFATLVRKYFGVEHDHVKTMEHKHHLAHCSLAHSNSGFDDCLVFVIDRNGSIIGERIREAETVFQCSGTQTKTLHKNFWCFNVGNNEDFANIMTAKEHSADNDNYTFNVDSSYSVVKVYESATTLIGQNPLENGKTMGLSSYGERWITKDLFPNGRPLDSMFIHGDPQNGNEAKVHVRQYIGEETDNITPDNYKLYADWAQTVQQQTEKKVVDFVKEWVYNTGIKKVCITGGYGLNVLCNERLVKELPDVEFFFEPLADDSGNSIGAALQVYKDLSGDSCIKKLEHTFTHGVAPTVCYNLDTAYTNPEKIAQYIAGNKSVAVFHGKAESGPRALGHRSILFNAMTDDGRDIVNKIKRREWYRPFAGMVLKEDFAEYFETHGLEESPFMTISFKAKDPKSIPSIVHVDGTCRVQTVDKSIPHIYEVLSHLKLNTGCSCMLNTSFNLAGEALVETQDDAMRTFYNSDIDVLWFPEINQALIK